jgi:OmpA-OmpF porin, OOP family
MPTSRNRRRKMPAFDRFNPFALLTKEISSRYHLGPKGRSLVQETLDMIAEEPGGMSGFLDRLKAAGFTAEVASWLGAADPMPLSGQAVERMLGSDAIGKIANKAGVSQGFATTVLGRVIPGIIARLGPSSESPIALSSFQADEIMQPEVDSIPPNRTKQSGAIPWFGWWLVPGAAALLIALGVAGYFVSSGGQGHRAAMQSTPVMAQNGPTVQGHQSAPSQTQSAPGPAQNGPVPVPHTPSIPARLALSNNNGVIEYSGIVGDDATRTAVTDSLKKVFGVDKITGDLLVDQHAGPAGWTKDLRAALDEFRTPGLRAVFEGDTVSVGGPIPDTERVRIVSSLKSVLGPEFAFATIPSSGASQTATAGSTVTQTAASSAPASHSTRKTPISAPNQPTFNLPAIYFATNSAKVPQASKAALQQAAGLMKQLPAGTVVWISSYPGSTGNLTANTKLTQRRVNVVRQYLIGAGVNPAILKAKVYTSPQSIATNGGPMEGRSRSTMKGRPHVEFSIAAL